MKKKIGFIDLFIDEWHANNYPNWIRTAPLAENFELGPAWEEQTKKGGRPLDVWCRDFGMTPAASAEEVVAESDAIFVLAPSNPEAHYRLAEPALRSGKPLFIDKPFAPDGETARKTFALAEKYNTPLMSSSALRFSDSLLAAREKTFAGGRPLFAQTTGGGSTLDEYGVHQLEMIVSSLGTGAKRVRQRSSGTARQMLIDYADGRFASLAYHPAFPFTVSLANDTAAASVLDDTHMFENLIAAILKFFMTGVSPVDKNETIEIAALLGKGLEALKTPGQWLDL